MEVELTTTLQLLPLARTATLRARGTMELSPETLTAFIRLGQETEQNLGPLDRGGFSVLLREAPPLEAVRTIVDGSVALPTQRENLDEVLSPAESVEMEPLHYRITAEFDSFPSAGAISFRRSEYLEPEVFTLTIEQMLSVLTVEPHSLWYGGVLYRPVLRPLLFRKEAIQHERFAFHWSAGSFQFALRTEQQRSHSHPFSTRLERYVEPILRALNTSISTLCGQGLGTGI